MENENLIYLKSERDGLGEKEPFSKGIEGLTESEGIVVAVEVSKHDKHRIKEMMEQSGAEKIIED